MSAARVDGNQAMIVKALRDALGCSVQYLHAVGQGCPDLLIGWNKKNVLLEIKDGNKKPSARRLTESQQAWHSTWKGVVHVVESAAQAIEAVRNG